MKTLALSLGIMVALTGLAQSEQPASQPTAKIAERAKRVKAAVEPGRSVEPVVRNGISLLVQMERAVIEPGQDIVINVTLKNVSGKDIACYRTNRDNMRFLELATGTVWVTQASLYPPPPASPPSLFTFKAGEELSHSIRFASNTRFAHKGAKPEDARVGLPSGRYRLEYSTTFMDHYPEKQENVYTATLQFSPIPFEIRGNPAPLRANKISMKGWELYVWQEGGETLFSLLPGTNRLKTDEEIAQATVKGLDAIKPKLDELEEGQYVFLRGRRLNERVLEDQAKAVAEYCRKLGLKVQP